MTSSASRRPASPGGGTPSPQEASLPGGESLLLAPLAVEICRRYREEFPDEAERYGEAGVAWCVHDTQYMLFWAALDLAQEGVLAAKLTWLARVLEARDFPLDRLVRDLELAAEVVEGEHPEAGALADRLRAGRAAVDVSR
jgi:hypothetical protein